MKTYTFECYDGEEKTRTLVEFDTESDAWSGFDGPMWKFYDFLKGAGFVFDINTRIGVMSETDVFTPAEEGPLANIKFTFADEDE